MSRMGMPSLLDFASLGMLAGHILFFASSGSEMSSIVSILSILVTSFLLWGGLRNFWRMPAALRITIALMILMPLWRLEALPQGRITILLLYFLWFVFFSMATSRYGSLLRLMSGFFAGTMVLSLAPPSIGISISVILALVFVGAQIGIWSRMPLGSSLIWFAKRSIRKETVFVIIFLMGIAALGLQQAQIYAVKQMETSGLSHMITPGNSSHLALSPALAMRVKMLSPLPVSPEAVYFRAGVMDRFAGFDWVEGPSRLRKFLANDDKDISYEVALSARHAGFAPIIDYGVSISPMFGPAGMALGRDNGVFFPLERHETWIYYKAQSRLEPLLPLAAEDRERLLQVPRNMDGRVLDLAQELAGYEPKVHQFTANLARFLQTEGFKYSLAPESPGAKLSDFLFSGKSGFCEHYASAAAGLARMAGIPARVVAGFLGGQWDRDEQTLYVRDLDAHAWSELWNDETKEWVRFDPVEFVAPERVSGGAVSYLRSIGADIPDDIALREKLRMTDFFMTLDSLIAAINTGAINSFADSLIDYGGVLTIIGLFGLIASFVMMRIRNLKNRNHSAGSKYAREISGVLSKLGNQRLPGETMHTWVIRCAENLHVLAPYLYEFAEAHAKYCYSNLRRESDLLAMKQSIRNLRNNFDKQKDLIKSQTRVNE